MAAGKVPMTRTIRHPRRPPQHHEASAVGDYAVYSDPELRLRHLPSLQSVSLFATQQGSDGNAGYAVSQSCCLMSET